jgi:translation initiation factor IF-1
MTRARLTAAMLLGALATGGTLAHGGDKGTDQQSTDKKNRGFVVETVGSTSGNASLESDKQTWTSHVNDGEHTYELRVEDGVIIIARIDGKDLPKERVRTEKNVVVFLGKDGETLYEFKSAPQVRTWVQRRSGNEIRIDAPETPSPETLRFTTSVTRPKTMIGLYQSEVPDAVAEHLGIEGDAIMIESVIPGLPADKAGLRAKDVIVSINGSDGVTSSGLTKILGGHEAGDEVKVEIIRKGERKTVMVRLASYDAEALGNMSFGVTVTPSPAPTPRTGLWVGERGRALRDEALREIERSLHEHGLTSEQIDEIQGAVRESLQELEETVRQAVEAGGDSARAIGQTGRETRTKVQREIMDKLRAVGLEEDHADEIDRVVRESLKSVEESVREATAAVRERFADFPDVDSEERRAMLEEMMRKAEAAMRQAERQIVEFKEGRLVLRNQGEDLKREFFDFAKQLEDRGDGMTEELDARMDALEDRLDSLDDRLDRIMDMLEDFADRLDADDGN